MTKDAALELVAKVILAKTGGYSMSPDWKQRFPQALAEAETLVEALEALGLLKLS